MRRTLIAATLAAAPALAEGGIETPAFDTLAATDAPVFEGGAAHRRYAPTIVAEVTVRADDAARAASLGFAPLASYIFGRNRPGAGAEIAVTAPVVTGRTRMAGGDGQGIAMTAPVGTRPEGGGLYTVRFHMPSRWTLETLPAPVDPAVTLREMPAREVVVAGWTGPDEEGARAGAEARARGFADRQGLTVTGPFERAGYDGPDTPAAQKRWAVMAAVEPAS